MYNDTQDPNGGGYGTDPTQTPPTVDPFAGWTPPPGAFPVGQGQQTPGLLINPDGTVTYNGQPGSFHGGPHGVTYFVPGSAATPPPPTPPPSGTGGGAGGGGLGNVNLGDLLQPYGGTFTPPSMLDLGGQPGLSYIPPTPTPNLPTFHAPTFQDLLTDPSYQFRVGQGVNALSQSAAAKGTLNDTGTAKGLMDYGQQAGSQEMQNYWNRAVGQYGLQYQQAMDTFAPSMTGYATQAAAGSRQNELNYNNAFSQFNADWQRWKDNRDSVWDKSWAYTTT